MATPNDPFFIALQVVPSIAWGDTAAGKTSSIRALMQKLGKWFLHLNGATHVAEDFSGYPNPDFEAGVVRQMPPSWVENFKDGNGCVMLDEFTCTTQATLAGELTLLSDNMVGDHQLPPTTLKCAAANPPEQAPNSAPLPMSIRSRFFHWQWTTDREALFAGYRNGLKFEAPDFPLVPEWWQDGLAKFGALVEQFLRSAPDCLSQMPTDDSTMAFPQPRGWEFVIRTLTAASAAGYDDKSPMMKQLAEGCVGTAAASEFVRFLAKRDLIDAEAVLNGTLNYTYEKRVDLNICLLTGLVQGLRRDNSEERWCNAAKVFIEMGSQGEIETCLMAFRPFWNDTTKGGVRPAGWIPPKEIIGKLMEIAQV